MTPRWRRLGLHRDAAYSALRLRTPRHTVEQGVAWRGVAWRGLPHKCVPYFENLHTLFRSTKASLSVSDIPISKESAVSSSTVSGMIVVATHTHDTHRAGTRLRVTLAAPLNAALSACMYSILFIVTSTSLRYHRYLSYCSSCRYSQGSRGITQFCTSATFAAICFDFFALPRFQS